MAIGSVVCSGPQSRMASVPVEKTSRTISACYSWFSPPKEGQLNLSLVVVFWGSLRFLRTILSAEVAHDSREDGAATWTKPLSPYLEEQSMYRDGPGTSYMHHTRAQTIDSAQTLVHSHYSPPVQARESFSQARPGSNQLRVNAEAADVLSLERSPSHFTEQSSLSDAQWSRELGQSSRLIPHRPSDASVDGRTRQMSFGTIASNDSNQGQPLENTVFPPLEIPDHREKHDCPEELDAAFLQSFDSIGNEILDESWIRVATWWLIKVICSLLMRFGADFDSRKLSSRCCPAAPLFIIKSMIFTTTATGKTRLPRTKPTLIS